VARGSNGEAARCLREALRHVDGTAAQSMRREKESHLRAKANDSWLLHASGRFLGHRQIDRLLEDAGHEGFRGEHKDVVVLFSDIRGFTGLSEILSPDELVSLLNELLTRMTWCIEYFGGSVDKFIGDAVMAVFPLERGADAAVAAALAMQDELSRYNSQSGARAQLGMGVGLHAGRVVAGLVGSAQKREHTILGDVVNTASRMEGMTKQLGVSVLVSDAVVSHLKRPERWILRPMGCYAPKGRRQGVHVHALEGEADEAPETLRTIDEAGEARKALEHLRERRFELAERVFGELQQRAEGLPRAAGYALLHRTASAFTLRPPGEEWQGEIPLHEK
jgi:class 3 adenylate cyclase